MQSLSLNNPWNFTTLGWFKGNALNAIGEGEDTLDRAKLTDFIEALRELGLNEVRIPLTNNDKQKNGPLHQILNAVPNASEIINTIINKIKNNNERIGLEILGLVRLIVENDPLWNAGPVNNKITMKYLIAELPASARGFLVTKLVRDTRYFRPLLRDIALAFLGSILTFVNYMPSEGGIRYIYIGMSQDAWRALSGEGSAMDIVRRFRLIRNIFRQVFNVEFSLPLEFALIYATAIILQYLSQYLRYILSEQIRRHLMIGNYYLEILTLSREARSQNFVTQLDTYSINDYLIALRRTRMTRLITSLAGLLRHYECFKDNKGLAKDIAGLLNDVTVRVVRFVSNNDCSEIAELTYGVRSFIAEWGDVISNVKCKKHSNMIHQRIVERLESGLELVRC